MIIITQTNKPYGSANIKMAVEMKNNQINFDQKNC